MSSITTAVPTGPIYLKDFCIQELYTDIFLNTDRAECANATLHTTPEDFETICCNGMIVDSTRDLYAWPRPANYTETPVFLSNLVCCGVQGPQQGGFGPIIPYDSEVACTSGTPTPLASLAATNTGNAALYEVTYTSASYGLTATGDYIPTEVPYCLWVNTASSIGLHNITVAAAQITTLPPATTDMWGDPITTSSSTYDFSSPSTTTASTGTATISSSGSFVSCRVAHALIASIAISMYTAIHRCLL